MKLIDFDGMEYKVADEALLVRPIRELFRQDKSKKKEDFWKQMSYVWNMYDPRSNYQYITDETERADEIIKQEGLGKDWKPSPLLLEVAEIYKKQSTTTASLLLEDMRKSIDNLRKFLRDIDLGALDKNLRPIYQVSTMTSALKQIPELAKALVEAQKALAKDFDTEDSARGNAEKATFEDE